LVVTVGYRYVERGVTLAGRQGDEGGVPIDEELDQRHVAVVTGGMEDAGAVERHRDIPG
jgi:hypothetical protein